MLAGIKFVDRSEAERALEEETKALRKQKKKQKKEKKKRKHKEKRSALPGGKSDSGSDNEPASPSHDPNLESAATEAGAAAAQAASLPSASAAAAEPAMEREDWMTKSFPKAAASADAVPLPGAKPVDKKVEPKAAATDPQEGLVRLAGQSTGKAGSSRVGDGGASWRLKALARAKNQATDASDPNYGRRVGDIVSEQWGSLAQLTAGLTDTRAAHAKAHLLAAKERQAAAAQSEIATPATDKGGSDRQGRGASAHYLQDVKSSRAQMRRPLQAGSLSWRRGTSGITSSANRETPTASSSQDHARRDSSAEPRDAAEDTRPDRGDRDTDRADKHTREKGSAGHGDRLGDRHGDRYNSHRQAAEHGQHGRQQQQREQRRSKRPVVNPNSKQAELLASVAADMNTFSNDGSFMDSFAALQAAGGAHGQTGRPMPTEEEEELSLSDQHSDDESNEQHSDDESDEQQRPRGSGGANQGAAAALRAKLQGSATQSAPAGDGNKATAAALRARLMQGKQPSVVLGPNTDSAQHSIQDSAASESQARSVQLSAIDSKGRAVPGAFGRAAVRAGAPEGGRKPKRVQRFDAGERQRYFADDDKQQLGDLVAQQRYEGAADIDANLADNIMRKGKRFREKELDVDEEYDVDGGMDMYESRKKKGTKEQQVKRDRAAQIADHRRVTNAVDRCPLCFSSTRRPRHLTISLGQTAYLALPARGRLGEGHSIIVPTEHVASTRQVDEHIWTELRNFKKCLLQMHMAQGMDVIFMETAMQFGDARTHAAVHCIPVLPKITAKAPLYFKKGIDDAESEWSQHHAKRMIETGGKGLRGSIPANFPYFHVEFNLTKGFVHVIDDEAKFDPQFGRSIMIGLLGLPAEDMHRQSKFESTQMQQQWVADFAKKWDAYDWTKQLG